MAAGSSSSKTLIQAIWALPFADRASILSMSIIENDHEALAATHGMAEMTLKMAAVLSNENRLKIAAKLRDHADQIEHAAPQFGEDGREVFTLAFTTQR
jgi:hypothetical protein